MPLASVPAALLTKSSISRADRPPDHDLGQLALGLGIGPRPDEFSFHGLTFTTRGKRFDEDQEICRDVWSGKPVGGATNPAVPEGTRAVPI